MSVASAAFVLLVLATSCDTPGYKVFDTTTDCVARCFDGAHAGLDDAALFEKLL